MYFEIPLEKYLSAPQRKSELTPLIWLLEQTRQAQDCPQPAL